jgi:hypothetical protein
MHIKLKFTTALLSLSYYLAFLKHR